MSALTQSRKSEDPAFLGALTGWFVQLATRCARAVSQRRMLGELARLDDRMLKDIGLFRSDIDAAYSLPLGRDPIALLASRRTARSNYAFREPLSLIARPFTAAFPTPRLSA